MLKVPLGASLAVSTDSFLEGHHFFAGTPAEAIGYKALAVNLSDLAAMGAEPIGFTLALTLPKADAQFLAGFAAGLKMAAERYLIPLIGGDTTRGPLSVTITVLGAVLPAQAFRRSAANPGDFVCVTGPLGGAALAVTFKPSVDMFKPAPGSTNTPKAIPRAIANAVVTMYRATV